MPEGGLKGAALAQVHLDFPIDLSCTSNSSKDLLQHFICLLRFRTLAHISSRTSPSMLRSGGLMKVSGSYASIKFTFYCVTKQNILTLCITVLLRSMCHCVK